MPITVANVETTSTFEFWRNRTNELADAMSTSVLTVGSTATGNVDVAGNINATSLTVGANVTISQSTYFVGNSTVNSSLTSSVLQVGNSFVTNSSGLFVTTSTSNLVTNSSGLFVNSIAVVLVTSKINVRTTGTSTQIVDVFNKTVHSGAEYVITIRNNSANAVQFSRVGIFHDEANTSYITEYALMVSNNQLAVFSTNVVGSNCNLLVTPLVSNTQIKATKIIVDV